MALFIIGDLHLSFSSNKPMDVFGPKWQDHHLRIKEQWETCVSPEDTVIVAGDISWAISLEEAFVDLAWLDQLPGKKLLLRGNHDYWWGTLKKMKGHFDTIDFIQNNAHIVEGVGIVGTRGWTVPINPQAEDYGQELKVFDRECQRLKLSIGALDHLVHQNLLKLEDQPPLAQIVAILHYPPFDERGRNSPINTIIEETLIQEIPIKEVYFGHIHSNYHMVFQGDRNQINYQLISADYIDFKPHLIKL